MGWSRSSHFSIQAPPLFLSGGLGEQRWLGEEAAVHPRGWGGWWGAELRVPSSSLPAASQQGPQLAPALPSPAASAFPCSLRPLAPFHPADTSCELEWCTTWTQPQVKHTDTHSVKLKIDSKHHSQRRAIEPLDYSAGESHGARLLLEGM